jgi:hypothetical protein
MLFSCGSNEKTDDIVAEDAETVKSIRKTKFNAQNVFNTLPDRKEVMKLIEDNKLEYNPDLLNDPTGVSKYTVEFFKAANLGIYGSDLSIASSFDQTQESMVFLKCVNVLAGSLGVNSAFDQRMFDRIQANNNNKDSILEIITGAFRKVDEILKNNNRPATSAVILSGCWIEGLYVSCQMAQSVNTSSLIKTIVGQRESLHNLIVMLEDVTLEEKSQFILNDLKSLYTAFGKIENTTRFDKKTIEEITSKISVLRKIIVTTAS